MLPPKVKTMKRPESGMVSGYFRINKGKGNLTMKGRNYINVCMGLFTTIWENTCVMILCKMVPLPHVKNIAP